MRFFIRLVICCGVLGGFASSAMAEVSVSQAYARETFAMARTGAVYLRLENPGSKDETLSSISTSTSVASEVQIHTTYMEGDMMQMRQITDGVVIPAGQVVDFAPGGYHAMLMGLKQPLKQGEEVPLTLRFDSGQEIRLSVSVKAIDKGMDHHHHSNEE